MVVEFLLNSFGAMALQVTADQVKNRLLDKAAAGELAEICGSALTEASNSAPALRFGFETDSFLKDIIVPTVRALLDDPSEVASPQILAQTYVDTFVARFTKNGDVDATLARLFMTDRATLISAFGVFFSKLASGLYGSRYWSGLQHYRATEAGLAIIKSVDGKLDAFLDQLRSDALDIENIKSAAIDASYDLTSWPTEIDGLRLESPALAKLQKRIKDHPTGTTLVIGESGVGKSALLAKLAAGVAERGATAFGIKADMLDDNTKTIDDVAHDLGVNSDLVDTIVALAGASPVVVIIDQLDAVSELMDRSSARMRALLQLVAKVKARSDARTSPLPIHFVVSSRPFEAAYDVRFKQLNADELTVGFLEPAQVNEMLTHLGVAIDRVDPALKETLRRPFALKLFADLVKRQVPVSDMTSSRLLELWLITANLGSASDRADCLTFLRELANEMIRTESLWRPADRFEINYSRAVRLCLSCGLVKKVKDQIGFSHQAWLDDFQAKSHVTGQDLADYIHRGQDSLFVRATVLRSLQRMRAYDLFAYEQCLAAVLGSPSTRRHILHLLVDILCDGAQPLPSEVRWVVHYIFHDNSLALRALSKVFRNWHGWRHAIAPHLGSMMISEPLQWITAAILGEEAKAVPVAVLQLVEAHWPNQVRLKLHLLESSGFQAELLAWLPSIAASDKFDEYQVPHLVNGLRTAGLMAEAVLVVRIWVRRSWSTEQPHPRLHDAGELAKACPAALVAELLPWFVEIALIKIEGHPRRIGGYCSSASLPWDWNYVHNEDSIFEVLRAALIQFAQVDPDALWNAIEPILGVEVDEVQELIAISLTNAGAKLATKSLEFLLGDRRRLSISDAHANDTNNVGYTIHGWHSAELVAAIAPHISDEQLRSLVEYIEQSPSGQLPKGDAEWARLVMQANEEHRLQLLERVPADVLTTRRQRQIREWRAQQRVMSGPPNIIGMATAVGAPMSATEMIKAKDSDIIKLLDELVDGSGDFIKRTTRRPTRRSGGVHQLAQAFGVLAKEDPSRAIRLARETFAAGKHETVAGDLVRSLAELEDADSTTSLDLIDEMNSRGFKSYSWKQDVAWALQSIAYRSKGLSDRYVSLLVDWIERDPAVVSAQIAQLKEARERNRASTAKDRSEPSVAPKLFGREGGANFSHHRNYTLLSALAAGLLSRRPPDRDHLLDIAEAHLSEPEDPEVWAMFFARFGRYLSPTATNRLTGFLDALYSMHPTTFSDGSLAAAVWMLRDAFNPDTLDHILRNWLASDVPGNRQVAAEFITAATLLDAGDKPCATLYAVLDRSCEDIRIGEMFGAVACWRDTIGPSRLAAHVLITKQLPDAGRSEAIAAATAFGYHAKVTPDNETKALLTDIAGVPAVLSSALNRSLTDAMGQLMLHPDFDETVLNVVEKATDLVADGTQRHRWSGGKEVVEIAVSLQKNDGPLRSRAMDVYERLLDANIYGAEQVAKATLAR